MLNKKVGLIALICCCIGISSCSKNDDNGIDYTEKREQVIALVDSSITLFEKELNNGVIDFSQFWSGLKTANDVNLTSGSEYYIFVFNINDGTVLVHPSLELGSDIRDVVSEDNPPIPSGQQVFDAANVDPSGIWTSYQYNNIITNTVGQKHTYVKVAGNYGFGSGYYEE